MTSKEELRNKYCQLRKEIADKKRKSQIIMNKLISDPDFIKAKVIAFYYSLNSEVDTRELINYSLKMGKVVLLPKVLNGQMAFYQIGENEELVKSNLGILEPLDNKNNLINKEEISLMIVPGICFDFKKNRLGFGRGYYDYYLKDSYILTIALCFDEQLLLSGDLPISKNDVKVKKIITDKRII